MDNFVFTPKEFDKRKNIYWNLQHIVSSEDDFNDLNDVAISLLYSGNAILCNGAMRTWQRLHLNESKIFSENLFIKKRKNNYFQ
ncbi:MAG: hypothetical protein ABIQ74_12165 [Chitinophagales bacterium]